MDKELLDNVYRQWKAAKDSARHECEARGRHNLAEAFRRCSMFRGNEGVGELAELFKSPQGLEFCLKHHFPSIGTLRLFKGDNPEQYGIYIDSGAVTLDDPDGQILLIGRTMATVNCTSLKRYGIACMHGAKAVVNASGWAVVHVESDRDRSVIRNASEHAIII